MAASRLDERSEVYTAFDADPAPIAAFVRRLAEHYRLEEPLEVLDAGCGPGRLLPEYARFGWRVVGLEPEPDFAATAEQVAATTPGVEVLRGGFGDLEERDRFHLVAAVNGAFAYLLSPAERRDALARCRRALRPGGVVLLDLPNLLRFAGRPVEVESATTQGGEEIELEERRDLDLEAGFYRQENLYTVSSPDGGEEVLRGTHDHAVLLPAQVERLLRRQGYDEILTFPGYDAREPGRRPGERFLISGRRTEEPLPAPSPPSRTAKP